MKSAVALVLAVLLAAPALAPALIATGVEQGNAPLLKDSSAAGGGRASDGLSGGGPAAGEQNWWSHWFRDADRDHIDDILEQMDKDAKENIFVDYSRRPTAGDAGRLGPFGSGVQDLQYIDTLALYDVKVGNLGAITRLPGVVMVEYQPQYTEQLDISVPSLRVRPSTTYANDVWDMLGIRGNGSVVAIIDTGVDNRLHESLDDLDDNPATSDPKFIAGYDCSGTVWFTGDPVDNDGHGTHVAGIAIGTGGPQHTYEGVAPGARLVDIKVMNAQGSAPAGKVTEGIRWAIANKDKYNITVISLSLGTSTSSDGNDAVSQMVNQAVRNGLIAVVAAGNDGPSNTGLGGPAAADDAITVGATDDAGTVNRTDDTLALYSSVGPRASNNDLDPYNELKPEISAPGTNIMSALAGTTGSYVSLSGTSMACPHVSGICALIKDANGNLTPAQVKQVIKETAEARGTPYNSSLDPKYNTGFGDGIVDGYGAVRRALDLSSSNWSGPSAVGGGNFATFGLSMNWTRTEFTTGTDSLFFNVSIPGSWGKPSSLGLSGGSLAHTAELYPVAAAGQNWSVRGWLNYTGTPSSPTNLSPAISFDTFAPGGLLNASFIFCGKFEANGIGWNATNMTVRAVPAEMLEPDLEITHDDISFQPPDPSTGEIVEMDCRVSNLGAVGVNSQVGFYDGPPGTRTAIGRADVSVPGFGEGTCSIMWNSSAGRHTVYARADPDNRTAELDEHNNEANATLRVLGTNLAPTASLAVSTQSARTGDTIGFDGSASADADGMVVLYDFDFGDGSSTGWTTGDHAAHVYTFAGDFTVQLTVQDNGAGEGSATAPVTITEANKLTLGYFLDAGGALTLISPESGAPLQAPIPDGQGGSGFKDVGRWSAAALGVQVLAGGDCSVTGYIHNAGPDPVSGAMLEFSVLNNSQVVNSSVAGPYAIPAGANATVTSSFSLPATVIPAGSRLGLDMMARLNGNATALLHGSAAFPSQLRLTLMEPPVLPPAVSAGRDVSGTLGNPVHLDGRGFDPQGQNLLYEWDFDGDGQFDYSGATGTVDQVYPASGAFTATLRVRNDAGLHANSSVRVTIGPKNLPPVIQVATPGGAVQVTVGDVQQFHVQAMDPNGDPLNFSWSFDGNRISGASSESYVFRATQDNIGARSLEVAVSDGISETSYSWRITVVRQDQPPRITASYPAQGAVSINVGDTMRFSLTAMDPDGDKLAYAWLLDGDKVSSGPDFLFAPDAASVGTHGLVAIVSDGLANDTAAWNITVVEVDHPPKVSITSPEDGAAFPSGSEIFFEARASSPDGLALEYRWSTDVGMIGTSNGFSKVLAPGVHQIKLVVSDGRTQTAVDVTITVKAKPSEGKATPGFGALLLAPAVLAVVIWAARRRNER